LALPSSATEETAQVTGEHAIAHGQVVQQRQGVLLVEVGYLRVIGAQAEVFVDLVIATHVGQVRGGGSGVETPVGRGNGHG
jgi:hypothetical protein